MQELGLNSHCFSIEWSRIEPEEGQWDESEVDHYRRIVESLQRHNLTPFATLHHFTNPLWFEREGGWLSPRAPQLIARYAGYMTKPLGSAVPFCSRSNEAPRRTTSSRRSLTTSSPKAGDGYLRALN